MGRVASAPNSILLDGKKYILVLEEDYKLLRAGAPALPEAVDSAGTRPAIAFAEASIGRDLVKLRQGLGLTQKEFAEAAGIRSEVLNRAERGASIPSVRTLSKIESAAARIRQAKLKRPKSA